jgi:dGTPase
MASAKEVVRDLFQAYCDAPHEMQAGFAARTQQMFVPASAQLLGEYVSVEPQTAQRVVADYIAGMTDRFAAREHERLTGRRLLA